MPKGIFSLLLQRHGVAPQQRFIPFKEGPVEMGEGAVAFGIEDAPIAVVAHPDDVGWLKNKKYLLK
jgi:hypothetical protein